MKTNILKIIPAVLLLISTTLSKAEVSDPISWSFKSSKIEGNKYEIVFSASIDEGWHLYSLSQPEDGPQPISFTFGQTPHFKLVGTVKEVSKSTTEYDNIFKLNVSFFAKSAIYSQVIELVNVDSTEVNVNIDYQGCYSGTCTYLENDFHVNVGGESPVQIASTEQRKDDVQSEKPIDKKEGTSLWVFFFISFAAGLAGLLTPCVFPMIPMTVSYFMNKQGNRFNAIMNAAIFGLSIIAIYTSIGLLVSLTNVGANFTSQITAHWITNLIFFILFIVFAASFFGLFEIVLPGNLATKTDSKADKGGFFGSFFMALTTVIVSLSCVGPIVGALLVEAASGLGAKPIIGMFGFSLAFSIPFTIFAIFPSLLKSLPRSGGWMNSIKVVLGFIILAFSLKFLMIIDDTYHWGLLGRDVYLTLWISIFTLLGFYLLGKIKFKNDSEFKSLGFFRLIFAILTFAFVFYLIPGLIGAPLKSISGLLPPQASHSFDLMTMINKTKTVSSVSADNKSSLCETPLYADFLHLPYGLEGYFDYNQALACARAQKKPLFIDFVGHSCSNCKEMESKVWSDPRVLDKLRNDYVIVALYIDEHFELPENEWIISKIDGKVKKTIGKQNGDFEISRFNINGQPYYVLVDEKEQTLAEPMGYTLDVETFLKFLENGITEYNK